MKISWLQRHGGAFALAFFVGVCVLLPQCIAVWRAGEVFQGVYPQTQNDAQYYLARIQEVRDGYTKFAQPFLYEGKDGSPLQFWLPEVLVAKMGEVLFLDSQQALLFSDFFFPSIAALLTYGILYELTRRRSVSLVGTAFLFLGLFLNLFGRPISPQVVFVPMLGFILALLVLERVQSRRLVVVTGILFGSLFHTYAYHWMYATVALGLYGLCLLVERRWERAQKIFLVGVIGFVISIPYFLQFFNTIGLPEYHDTMARLGMLSTHFPSGIFIMLLAGLYVIVVGGLLLFRREVCDGRFILVSALALAVPVVTNQHVITGQNLEFSSHYRTLSIFVSLFGYAFLLQRYLDRWGNELLRLVSVCLLGILVAFSVWSGYRVALSQTRLDAVAVSEQRYTPLFAWLSLHADKDAVVYANIDASYVLPAYTSANVFYARQANMHFMTEEAVWEKALMGAYFEPMFAREALIAKERTFFGTHYINKAAHEGQQNKARALFGISPHIEERYPESDIEILVDQWHLNAETPFRELIKGYRIDYILWDKKTDPQWQPKLEASELTAVFQSDDFVLYEL